MSADMDKILEEMKGEFLQDCREKLSRVDEIQYLLEQRPEEGEGLLVELKRHVHSLKGNAGSFGFSAITHIAHSMEDLIGNAVDETGLPWGALETYTRAISEIVESGENPDDARLQSLISSLHEKEDKAEDHAGTALIHIPEKVWSNIISRELSARDYRIANAETAIEAIDRGVVLQPELLVTSMQLEHMTGLELAAVFSALKVTSQTRILVLASQKQDLLDRMERPVNAALLSKGSEYRAGLGDWLAGL